MVVDKTLPCAWQLKCLDLCKRADRILEVEQWTDCSFLVGSEQPVEHKAHKLLLAMSSPVFEAMFYGPMAQRDASIRVTDVDSEVFELMLKYIYSNNVVIGSVELAINLLFTAEKYLLPGLSTESAKWLSDNLTPKIVCHIYEIALMFTDKQLTMKCEEMLKEHTLEALKSDSFEDLKLDTVEKIFSLEEMKISSELELIRAAELYWHRLEARKAHAAPEELDITMSDNFIDCSNDSPVSQQAQDYLQQRITRTRPFMNILTGLVDLFSYFYGKKKPKESQDLTMYSFGSSHNFKGDGSAGNPKSCSEKSIQVQLSSVTPVNRPMLPVLRKIRFLTLTPKQLAEEMSLVTLLTMEEIAAILINASADKRKCTMPMPNGFSNIRRLR